MNDSKPHRVRGLALSLAPSYLACAALFSLMLMTFFDVVLRSVANNPIEAATEMTRLFMAVIVFASLPIVSWRGDLIVVDLLDSFVSKGLSKVRDVLIDVFCGAVLLWPASRVWALADRALEYGDTTEYLEIPQAYIAYFIAISTTVTAVLLIVRGLARIFRPSWLIRSPALDTE